MLLHKKEIARLAGIQAQQGMAIIPLKVYLKHGFAKVLIGVGQGKKQYDKRQTIKSVIKTVKFIVSMGFSR